MSEVDLNAVWHRLGVTEAQNRELLRMVADIKQTTKQLGVNHGARIARVENAINFVKYGSVAVAGIFTLLFNSVGEFLRHIK